MTRLVITAGVVVGAVAGGIGGLAGGPVGLLVGVLVGVLIGWLVSVLLARRVDDLTRTVTAWVDATPEMRRSIPAATSGPWRRLGRALNALGTEQDRLRRAEEQAPQWRRHLVESLAGPALLFDQEGTLVVANDAARQLFRHPHGVRDLSVAQALGSGILVAAVRDAMHGHRPVLQVAADIDDRHVVASVSVIGAEVLVIATDRTEERRVEDLRRNFVINASHELKTPATAIQTLAEALEVAVAQGSDRVPSLVKRLGGEADRLGSMVHDLLNLRRLEETGPIERAPLDVVRLVAAIVDDLEHRAEARGVQIELSGPDELTIDASAEDLGLALRNLVANAVQYNRRGGRVDVGVGRADDGCRIVIADTGIGIPQQDLPKVFERFYRVDVARSRESGGTGLGLSIVRHVIERHGGSIAVDSLLGDGTTFTVWLPGSSNASMAATER